MSTNASIELAVEVKQKQLEELNKKLETLSKRLKNSAQTGTTEYKKLEKEFENTLKAAQRTETAINKMGGSIDQSVKGIASWGDILQRSSGKRALISNFADSFNQIVSTSNNASGAIRNIGSVATEVGLGIGGAFGPIGLILGGLTSAFLILNEQLDLFGDKAKENALKAQESFKAALREIAADEVQILTANNPELEKKKIELENTIKEAKTVGGSIKEMNENNFKGEYWVNLNKSIDDAKSKIKYYNSALGNQSLNEERRNTLIQKRKALESNLSVLEDQRISYIAQANAKYDDQIGKIKQLKAEISEIEKAEKNSAAGTRTPTKTTEKKLTGSQWNKVDLGTPTIKPIQATQNKGDRTNDLLGIDPNDLETLAQLNSYISQMNVELQNAQIGSETYNKLAAGIQAATERQTELNNAVKNGNSEFENQQKAIASAGSILGSMSSAMGAFAGESEEAAIAMRALAIAEQVAALAAAIHNAASKGDPYTTAARIAAAAAGVIGSIAAAAATTHKFANGGMIDYGTEVGDKTIARVNRGEAVFTNQQLRNLNNYIAGHQSGANGVLYSRISGRDIIMSSNRSSFIKESLN